jgi:hypothetical protein
MSQKLLQKIKNLIEHEKSARKIGSIHEAKAFAERIQNLIEKYSLDVAEIDALGEKEEIKGYVLKFAAAVWQKVLLSGIAKANSCGIAFSRGKDIPAVVGYKDDVEIVVSLYDYFSRLAEEYADKLPSGNTYFSIHQENALSISLNFNHRDKNLSKDSFLLGFAQSISKRFSETKATCEEKEKELHPESLALVRINNKSEEVNNWMLQKLTVVNAQNPTVKVDKEAYDQGIDLGEDVALTNKTIEGK